MGRTGSWLAGWMAVSAVVGTGIVRAQEQSQALSQLATRLNLSEEGVRNWLNRLGADGTPRERLLVLSASGAPLAERSGGKSSVVVDEELEQLLQQPGMAVVLVHNHPRSVGLSGADIGQLAKPGVTAILAIGHDGSAFLVSAGHAMDRDLLKLRYVDAMNEVKMRLRTRPPDTVSGADSDIHFNHLVTGALAEAGVIQYWFALRGHSLKSYWRARIVFHQIVAGAGKRLRRCNPRR